MNQVRSYRGFTIQADDIGSRILVKWWSPLGRSECRSAGCFEGAWQMARLWIDERISHEADEVFAAAGELVRRQREGGA